MRAPPGVNPPLEPMPEQTEEARIAIEVGHKFSALEETQGYEELRVILWDRAFLSMRNLAGCRSGDEALRECGVLSSNLEALGIVPGKAEFGREAELAFRERYEAASESQRRAQQQSFRRGRRTTGSSVPAT